MDEITCQDKNFYGSQGLKLKLQVSKVNGNGWAGRMPQVNYLSAKKGNQLHH